MNKIQDLFDPSKQLNREIESVVTFGANTEKDLHSEISEYVVTAKLHNSYEKIIDDFQRGFDDGSKEVGVWVSGFYGSGKSSFAKYLGLSFDKSLMIDGVTFGERLMSRVNDQALTAMHKTIIQRHNPIVIMIDLSTEQTAGKTSTVSDIVYYETLKQLGFSESKDQKIMTFINLLHTKGRYDEFCQLVESEFGVTWAEAVENDLEAQMYVSQLAPRIFPRIFPDADSFDKVNLSSSINEKERFTMLYGLIKERTQREKVIFVLDEIGQYVASDPSLILNVQGMMQIFKDEFRGSVWVIGTAQQTLTEDNPDAQLNSNQLFKLNDRFPEKVDIEAEDIKEIITRRLLGKSVEGKNYLKELFGKNEGLLKNNLFLSLQEKTIYSQLVDAESFANLYPFLPVHIDILMQLLQKLASRTGGVGLRSVIRLIRDILVDNHLADATIGLIAGPDAFYDVLHADMERGATREVVQAADKAISIFTGNALAIRICKTIAVMQLLDDFKLTFDNLCALLYNEIGGNSDKVRVRDIVTEIIDTDGLTLQEIEGKFQFMTSAILTIRAERNAITPREADKVKVMQDVMQDIFTSSPTVNVYGSKTINASVDLSEKGRNYNVYTASSLKLNVRFVSSSDYDEMRRQLLSESTLPAHRLTVFWLCTLAKDKEAILLDIAKSKTLVSRHQMETNKEIQSYIKAQEEYQLAKTRELRAMLVAAQANSEIIFRGSPQQVTADTYKSVALKEIAEKVYEKFPLAATNMKSDSVTKLASYNDLTTLPDSLNPFKMVNKSNGTIDVAHPAFVEVKDFINKHSEPSGAELLAEFEKDPYGWSKDTTRYIVALMLKASMIQVRAAGKTYKVFGTTACEVLGGNTSFNKVSISLNTSEQLSMTELVKAAASLTSLFNSPRTAPVADQIASEAYKQVKRHKTTVDHVKQVFEQLHLAGLQTVNNAQRFMTRIEESEGGEAPALLGKDKACADAIKYVLDFEKSDKSSGFVNSLRHIKLMIDESRKLQRMDQLDEYIDYVETAHQKFEDCLANDAIYQSASDVTDLKNAMDSQLQKACVEFETSSNALLQTEAEKIRLGDSYVSLSDSQKQQIEGMMNTMKVSCRCKDISGLHEMIDGYTNIFIPGGTKSRVEKAIASLVKANQPVVTTTSTTGTSSTTSGTGTTTGGAESTTTGSGSTAGEQQVTVKKVSVKRRFTNRTDLQKFIDELTLLLDKVNDETPVDLSITEGLEY